MRPRFWRVLLSLFIAVGAIQSPLHAAAAPRQTPRPRRAAPPRRPAAPPRYHGIFVTANGSFQAEAGGAETLRPVVNGEASVVETKYRAARQPGFDVGAGFQIAREFVLGVAISNFSRAGSASVSAQSPHPFFFNQLRPVAGESSGLHHRETAVNLRATYRRRLTARWGLDIFGGPSWVQASRDVVRNVAVSQTYPYDTATFASAVTAPRTTSRVGFNAGVDAFRYYGRHAGIGVGADYTHARVSLAATRIDAGGAHVYGGLRLRY